MLRLVSLMASQLTSYWWLPSRPFVQSFIRKFYAGVHGVGATPVTIPNTEVKPHSGYNTWVLTLGK
jgi:hypothetical protein